MLFNLPRTNHKPEKRIKYLEIRGYGNKTKIFKCSKSKLHLKNYVRKTFWLRYNTVFEVLTRN